ncbi:MAG: hypothetical protein MJ025_01150 [Victivallaceae bacterium]|nr:hypothetical protein [Victivallaceae bacterium]
MSGKLAAALELISNIYPEGDLRNLLLEHSESVRDKALSILSGSPFAGKLDGEFVSEAAMLHDIGIIRCDAPGILCHGTEPYIRHGVIGAGMLRAIGPEMERYARICERHTGCGLSANDILRQNLPLPETDYLPETVEEKLICLADKFFSKSGDMKEKPLATVRRSMDKFGPETTNRFEQLCSMFSIV